MPRSSVVRGLPPGPYPRALRPGQDDLDTRQWIPSSWVTRPEIARARGRAITMFDRSSPSFNWSRGPFSPAAASRPSARVWSGIHRQRRAIRTVPRSSIEFEPALLVGGVLQQAAVALELKCHDRSRERCAGLFIDHRAFDDAGSDRFLWRLRRWTMAQIRSGMRTTITAPPAANARPRQR